MWIENNPKIFISAPFGNYIKSSLTIPVTGTFTLHPRGNRLWSVLKTLRYNRRLGGWVNKLGLPNPGLRAGLERHIRGEVLSIAETERGDFQKMNNTIPLNQSLEINFSCPNLKKKLPLDGASIFTKVKSREWCIAKLSPLTDGDEIEFVIEKLGFKQLHFSNTLPLPYNKGGLSGATLKPYTLELIELVRERWGDSVTVIAGGGVTDFSGVMEYLLAGANHVSIGSVCFNPFKLRKLLKSLTI
jgi:dihydroorotate dehydrogenase|tara:strand:+ start:170 stop:901 length:732 start_codon:yes stop_codon:yes gene_type:complete